jgi:sialic acid synthase SpsE
MLREIGRRAVGEGHPLFVIAELGLNHHGSLGRALALVDAAADAGASAIKLQSLVGDRLVTRTAPPPLHLAGEGGVASLAAFFRRFELDEADHRAVVRRARARGLAVLSTPLYEGAVDMLESIGIDGYKIASGDLTYAPLIERAARTGKPLLLSTGMGELDEIADAIGRAQAAGAGAMALLHCVSCYPVPAGSENLRAIDDLSRAFGLPVGLSDHGRDPMAPVLAVTLGACLYERHLVLAEDDEAVDVAVSVTPGQLADAIRLAGALGDGRKRCLPVEVGNRVPSRRSLRAARVLARGSVLTPDDIIALRPGDGLSPVHWQELIGVTIQRLIGHHDPFLTEDLGVRHQESHVA